MTWVSLVNLPLSCYPLLEKKGREQTPYMEAKRM